MERGNYILDGVRGWHAATVQDSTEELRTIYNLTFRVPWQLSILPSTEMASKMALEPIFEAISVDDGIYRTCAPLSSLVDHIIY